MDGDREKKQGVIGKIINLYSVGRAGAGILVAFPWLGPALLITLGVLTVFTFLIVLGGQGAATESQLLEQKTTIETSPFLKFSGATEEEIKEIQNILSLGLSSSLYKNLLTSAGSIIIEIDNTRSCQALVDTPERITLFGFSTCDLIFRRYVVLHETGHIIAQRNVRAWQSFRHNDFKESDSFCYDGLGYLKTYPRSFTRGGGGAHSESFAEAIALYLAYKNMPPLTDFPNQCLETYNWVRENIFQGSQRLR